MWKETTHHERNLTIWKKELEDFVPQRVLDFHVHVWPRGVLPSGETFSCGGYPIEHYEIEELREDLLAVYPGRRAGAVCFGLPFPQYNQAENDRYLARACDQESFFPLRLLDPAEDPDKVRRDVIEGRFAGVKPYPDYVRKADVSQSEIHEMLPPSVMEIADDLGLIVMLHIPRKDRLADPLNQRQITELCRRWPRARIVLAHIGRAYYLKGVVGYLEPLRDLPNLYCDLAMLNHWEVLEHTFQVMPHERILYGTDIPIALAPGKSVEINDQYTYITPVPWELAICDTRRKIVFTSFLYEELRAIKKAVQHLGLSRQFVENLFYHNGMKLLGR